MRKAKSNKLEEVKEDDGDYLSQNSAEGEESKADDFNAKTAQR